MYPRCYWQKCSLYINLWQKCSKSQKVAAACRPLVAHYHYKTTNANCRSLRIVFGCLKTSTCSHTPGFFTFPSQPPFSFWHHPSKLGLSKTQIISAELFCRCFSLQWHLEPALWCSWHYLETILQAAHPRWIPSAPVPCCAQGSECAQQWVPQQRACWACSCWRIVWAFEMDGWTDMKEEN